MYYLPIYVNNRRMHVVKLSSTADERLFSFLVNSSNHYDVFSLPSESIQLICDDNLGENVNLTDAHYTLERIDSDKAPSYIHCKDIPIFNVNICIGKGKNEIKDSAKDYFRFWGILGDTIAPGQKPFTLKAKALVGQSQQLKDYIIQFTYKTESTYVGAIRICEYDNAKKVLKSSLDFGSEASQILLSTAREGVNMNLRDAFVNIAGGNIKEDYWQGRKDDDKTLYKSIYHIHKEPAATNFGDMPMKNKEKNFLQSLLPVKVKTDDLIQLPNLKLVELLPNQGSLDDVTFKEDGFMGKVDKGPITANLTSLELSDGILRQILCNFLAVILKSEPGKEYLHFILLVPNVYLQEKVNKLVTGLYDDFNLLRENEMCEGYKGIEVSIVSESDASFFGVRARTSRDDLKFIKGANYLIIDAGKGTTDFSLISQQGDNLANYSSMYRSGIPASGHVLTYAFYDALRSYFHELECGEFFDEIMRKSIGRETSEILNFVSLLEQFKIKSGNLKEEKENMVRMVKALKTNNNNSLSDLNIFLKNVLNNNKMIPGMKAALDEKIKLMTNLLKDSIVEYTKKRLKGTTCHKVFLTGRAFMLKQFRDSVSKMLVENGIIDTEAGVFYNNSLTKSICTFGAMKVGEQSVVNKNSNMLGCPHLFEETGEVKKSNDNLVSRFKEWLNKKRRVNEGIGAEMSFNFFYEGLKLHNVKNAIFSLSGMDTLIGNGNRDDLEVYYVGDGYIWKHGGECGRIDSVDRISAMDEEVSNRLVKESVFPFNLASFGLNENPAKFNNNNRNNGTAEFDDSPVLVGTQTTQNPNKNLDALDR